MAAIQGQTSTVIATLNNPTNGTDLGSYTGITSNNGIIGPASGTAAVGNNPAVLQLANNANGSATLGNNSWTYTVTNDSNTDDTLPPKALTVSATVVQNRAITASPINAGRILVGGAAISTISGNGADNQNTTPSVNAVNFSPATGLTLNTGAGGILNFTNQIRTIGITFGQAGPVNTTINLATTSTAIFAKEGLTGETINGGNSVNLAITANPVNLRVLTPNPVTASGSINGSGPISIPFSFTSARDLATTTSVKVNNGGGTISGTGGAGASGPPTFGSYTFNGGQATIGNVIFNSGTDSYTASGTISGSLTAGQVVSGSITLPVTTLETGLGDTYSSIVVNFTATSNIVTTPALTFSPTTGSFGRVIQGQTPSTDHLRTIANACHEFSGVASNNGISAPAASTAVAGNNTVALQLANNANGSATLGNNSWTYTVTNTSNTADTSITGKTFTATADIVQNRVITASTISIGRILVGSTRTSTITGAGADNTNTTPSVAAVNFVPQTGLNFNTASGGILNAANTARTLTVQFNAAGSLNTTVNLNATSTPMFTKEGLTGEAINSGNPIPLAIAANPVNLRTFNISLPFVAVSAGGPVSIPFSFTSTGDFATTTSVIVNAGGGTISGTGGTGASGFSTSGSYTFNGGQANIGNVTFNAGNDAYTASGTITGTTTLGQTLTGSITLPVTTSESGLGDTYSSIVVHFEVTPPVVGNSLLNFIPGTASFGDVLLHATPTLNVNLNNGGTQSGNFTGVTSNNGLTGPATGAAAVGSNTLVLQLQNNANGTGALNATASYTYTITNVSNTGDTATPKALTVSANVGEAVADTTNQPFAFGAPLFGTVMGGNSYAALSSTVSAGNGLSNPINQTTGGPVEHTTATILAGNNGRPNPVITTMAWRTRNQNETPASQGGTPTSPPLPPGGARLISDVVNLTRIDAINGQTPTDPYAMQMNYDPATIGNLAQQNALAANRGLFLAWLDPNGAGPGMIGWDNAVLGDTGNNATPAERDFVGSFAAFQAINGTDLTSYIGAWGVDTSAGNANVWAVLNHTSQFAAAAAPPPVPEPATLALAAFGGLALCGWARRWRVLRGRR